MKKRRARPGKGRARDGGVEAALPVQNRTAPRLGKVPWDWADGLGLGGYFGLDSQ